MQQLEARGLVHVHKIHVESEEDVGVGDVGRFGNAADIPCRSIEGVPEGPHLGCNFLNHLPRVRDILNEDDAHQS